VNVDFELLLTLLTLISGAIVLLARLAPRRRAAGRAYRNVAMPRSMSARMERRYPIPRLAASIRASRRSGIRMSARASVRANRCVTGSAKPRSHSPGSARSTNASSASSVGRDGQGPSSSSIKSLHVLFIAWVGRRWAE